MLTIAACILMSTVTKTSTLPPLHCNGTDLVDPTGAVVRLKGVNLGGWLVEEIWMTPWTRSANAGEPETIKDHKSLWDQVSKHLGPEAMVHVRNAWRANWVTNEDFRRIKAAGFNHVRLPFLDVMLEEPHGIDILKAAVNNAKQAGLYVVLDLHGAPGGQSNEHHTGAENRNRLWFDVENISKTEAIWTRLAKEFADEPAVAAFDLINEPMGAPNPAMLHIVYDRIIRHIRTAAPNKVVIVDDGYKGFETTPHPNLANWTNVAFSLHFYQFEAKSAEEHPKILRDRMTKLKELQGYRNAPIYAGEFNLEPNNSPTAMTDFVAEFKKAGWSYSLWTWKAAPASGALGDWGLYRPKAAIEALNPFTDSEADLIRKFQQIRTDRLVAPAEQVSAVASG